MATDQKREILFLNCLNHNVSASYAAILFSEVIFKKIILRWSLPMKLLVHPGRANSSAPTYFVLNGPITQAVEFPASTAVHFQPISLR